MGESEEWRGEEKRVREGERNTEVKNDERGMSEEGEGGFNETVMNTYTEASDFSTLHNMAHDLYNVISPERKPSCTPRRPLGGCSLQVLEVVFVLVFACQGMDKHTSHC